MPTPNQGESKEDFISRCMAYSDLQDLEQDARFARCNDIWDSKKMSEESDIHVYFEPPDSGDAPQGVKDILRNAYSSCRTKWVKDYPNDRENQENKTSCAQQAWGAVQNAGWSKDAKGNWHKNNSEFRQSETYDVNDVEVFSVGKWNGDRYTEKDLDDMVSAYHELQNELKPYLKLGHSDKQVLLQKDGLPSAGWVTNLRRKGIKLVVDLKSIPKKIKELIEKKAYGRFSSEIYWDLEKGNKKYRRVLKAIALLGADTPAVQNLDDFINLYNENNLNYENLKFYDKLESDMDEQIVKDLQGELKEYKEKEKTFEADLKVYKEENEQLKKDNKDLEDQVKKLTDDIETKEKEQNKKEIKLFIDKAVEEKKILPSQVEKYTKLAESDFESVQDVIKNMPELDVNTDEESNADKKPKKYEAMSDEEKEDFKIEKAYALMKEDKNLEFRTAYEMVEQQLEVENGN